MSIPSTSNASISSYNSPNTNNDTDFDNLVLDHIKNTQPNGTLGELLDDMKSLSPDKPCAMQQLYSALQYSDSILRTDPDYIDYTTETLDKHTSQLAGLNMLMQNMLYNSFFKNDEDQDSI